MSWLDWPWSLDWINEFIQYLIVVNFMRYLNRVQFLSGKDYVRCLTKIQYLSFVYLMRCVPKIQYLIVVDLMRYLTRTQYLKVVDLMRYLTKVWYLIVLELMRYMSKIQYLRDFMSCIFHTKMCLLTNIYFKYSCLTISIRASGYSHWHKVQDNIFWSHKSTIPITIHVIFIHWNAFKMPQSDTK